MVAFALASAAVGMVYFMVFGTMHSRGFIPSTSTDYWIKAEHHSDNGWSFEVVHSGEDPPLTSPHGYTVLLQEQSGGRTGGLFNAFRASHWSFMYVDLPDGDFADKLPDARLPDGFGESLEEFVMTSIVPNSAAMAAWPHTDGRWADRSDDYSWTYWRRGTFVGQFAMFALLSLTFGACTLIALDWILKPLRRAK